MGRAGNSSPVGGELQALGICPPFIKPLTRAIKFVTALIKKQNESTSMSNIALSGSLGFMAAYIKHAAWQDVKDIRPVLF